MGNLFLVIDLKVSPADKNNCLPALLYQLECVQYIISHNLHAMIILTFVKLTKQMYQSCCYNSSHMAPTETHFTLISLMRFQWFLLVCLRSALLRPYA